MDIPSVFSLASLPAYGEISVYGVMNADDRNYVADIVARLLGFNVVFSDESCECVAFVARRLNIVNLGSNASVTVLADDIAGVFQLVNHLRDIEDPSHGDSYIDEREYYKICLCERVPVSPSPKRSVPGNSAVSELCDAQCSVSDWGFEETKCEHICFARDTPTDEDIDAEQIEAQRQADIEKLRNAILAYAAKYHADPQETIAELIKGKIVINPNGFSRIVVNGNTQIVLADYDETIINMGARERTLYIFFLKHLEGVRQVDIGDYKDELLQIYSLVKPGASDENAMRTIYNLCDPFSSALAQSLSKIKSAVMHAILDKTISRQYYIDGERGGEYRIAVKPELVTLPAALTN